MQKEKKKKNYSRTPWGHVTFFRLLLHYRDQSQALLGRYRWLQLQGARAGFGETLSQSGEQPWGRSPVRWGSFISACLLLGQTVLLGITPEASETPVALTIYAFSR